MAAIKRLLLVRNDRVGDLILTFPAFPAFEAARRALPDAHIAALVNPHTAPLLENHPHLDEVIPDRRADGGFALGRFLKPMDFDAAAVIHTTTRNCLAVWRARIPIRACWAYKPVGWLHATHPVQLHRHPCAPAPTALDTFLPAG